MEYPSRLIENAVQAFASLPGIGKKTALRLVIHLLKSNEHYTKEITDALYEMRSQIKFCKKCGNVADEDICGICLDKKRDHSIVCVVEHFRDIIAIENTEQYNGVYHVLGGLISPLDGIGPEQLNIKSLVLRVKSGEVKEMIMALSPTIEGDTTLFYLSRQFSEDPVKITTLARGVAFGGELEYVDEVTLARSLLSRRPYDNYLSNE